MTSIVTALRWVARLDGLVALILGILLWTGSPVLIAWAILLPYLGFAQIRLMPGASHVVIQVVHLLIGICAIGVVEATGAKIAREAKS